MMNSAHARVPARAVVLIALLAVVAFLAAFGITERVHRAHSAERAPRPSLPAVLGRATSAPAPAPAAAAAPAPTAAGVRAQLRAVVRAPGLGTRLIGRVVDARTGAVLFDAAGATTGPPASTAKLLTASAALIAYPATHRFATTIATDGRGTVVLVGGGDPTLTGAAPGAPPAYPGAARLSDLAAAVLRAKVPVRRIVVDDALFTGPSISPSWDPTDVGTSYGAAITAVMTDGGRAAPTAYTRSARPDLAAGHELAALLGRPNLPVARGTAGPATRTIGRVESAPLSELIYEMLQPSDNVIAEVLARQVALAEHMPASFTGGAAAIRTVLGRVGVPVGNGMTDGSGLSSHDRLSPAAIVAVLRLIAGQGPPATARVTAVAGLLPVAGWSGTLAERYLSGPAAVAAGRVRAKTGTLTGVSSLAGLVHDRSGRLLVFDLDADRTASNSAAEPALDDIAAALARCGCS